MRRRFLSHPGDARQCLQLLGIFAAAGAFLGLLRGDILLGALAGCLLFALMFAVGWLAGLGSSRLLPREE